MFRLERDMTAVISQSIDDFCHHTGIKSGQFAVAYELPVGYRIVDLMLAVVKEGVLPIEKPLLSQFSRLSGLDMEVLALFLIYRTVSVHKIRRALYMDWSCVLEVLAKFERLCLVKQTSKFSYTATEWQSWCELELVAVELKLENWREVLEQAKYNLSFSDYSFAVVDDDRISESLNIENCFKENNIGLVKMGSKDMMAVVRPGRNKLKKTQASSVLKIKLFKDLVCKGKWVIAE